MVVDIPINCCVSLLHLVPILIINQYSNHKVIQWHRHFYLTNVIHILCAMYYELRTDVKYWISNRVLLMKSNHVFSTGM